jgi:hypothetical protein
MCNVVIRVTMCKGKEDETQRAKKRTCDEGNRAQRNEGRKRLTLAFGQSGLTGRTTTTTLGGNSDGSSVVADLSFVVAVTGLSLAGGFGGRDSSQLLLHTGPGVSGILCGSEVSSRCDSSPVGHLEILC